MKKRTLFLAMVAALVAFAACNKEADTQITEGNSIEAVFEVSAPELATKAISDGLTANKLFFYLYDKNNALLFETNSSEGVSTDFPVTFTKIADKKWSVKVRLIKDMQYKIVFWAQNSDADAFTLNAANKTLSVDYSKMTLNADYEDAFWGTTGVFTVDGPATKVVTLKRPFAQLNVAIPAEDLGVASFMLGKYSKSVAAITTNYTLSSYAYNKMNLLDGTVSENAAETTPLTLVAQAKPDADITIGGNTYKHMAMAYVLVGDKVTNNVTLTVNTGADAIGAAGVLTRDILNVPLQRNYRTNIIGNIFSVEEEFTVEIDNNFDEDVVVPAEKVADFAAANAAFAEGQTMIQIQNSPNSSTEADYTLKLPKTTEAVYIYLQYNDEDQQVKVGYADGATDSQKPASVYVYALRSGTLTADVEASTLYILSGSYINGSVYATTAPATLNVQESAIISEWIKLVKGSLNMAGAATNVEVQEAGANVNVSGTVSAKLQTPANANVILESGSNVSEMEAGDNTRIVVESNASVVDMSAGENANITLESNASVTDMSTGENANINVGAEASVGTLTADSNTTIIVEADATVSNVSAKDENTENVNVFADNSANVPENGPDDSVINVSIADEEGMIPVPGSDCLKMTLAKDKFAVIANATLESVMDLINADPKEKVAINVADGVVLQWTTGSGHGSTPVIPTTNTITKELKIEGFDDAKFLAIGAGVGTIRATGEGKLIFKNITIEDRSVSYAEDSWEFGYLEFAGKVDFDNCLFMGGVQIETDNDTTETVSHFSNCRFVSVTEKTTWTPTPTNMYLVWVCSGTATFYNCDFTGYRGLKMHEAYGTNVAEVNVNQCIFHDISKKPGICIGTLDETTVVSITNSSFVNCQAGDNNLYAYETDTDVDNIVFTYENNTVENTGE